ncbi:MAG TPA: aminopeptidase [Leptospiraceae bacterium]|nr:aminopeptidase [Leptospiraceae bacterium]HMW04879.1 aminopeptidase [Leptospiraceae bacterium]HMX32562.1 aminopeptidase [Leptospiraceae bacterium]HMY30900.1 aminopeptidase [Leptospiraceae bacterium]HMZ62704.1 aminopeptidase [Leptospiraceae bacterium]
MKFSIRKPVLLFTLFFQNCIPYLYHVSTEQVKIILNRKPIPEVIESESEEGITRSKLKLIQKVREFAVKEIHLNPKGGFEYFTKLNREEVGWNVSASYPLKFESYTWWFPFAGTVPYKGYFDLKKAKEEEQTLIEKGFDTRVRITAAYSTLGWFSDPVMSPQLRMSEDELVSLVIHEMSHATVYFAGDSNFNESYASFVEEKGTELFYKTFHSEKANDVLEKRKKAKVQSDFIISQVKQTAFQLKEMYEKEDLSDEQKLEKKKQIIEDYRERILANSHLLTNFNPEKFKKTPLNNENFIGILRYHSGSKLFQDKFIEVGQDFKKFHQAMEELKALSVEERAGLLKE